MKVKYRYFGNNNVVSNLYSNAKGNVDKLPHPFKKYEDDFCYDVVATECNEIHPNVYEYKIGIGCQIDRKSIINELGNLFYRGQRSNDTTTVFESWLEKNLVIDIDLRPRSSIRDTGLILCNCEGTIDEGFTNEIKATFYHVVTDLPIYKVGDKIGQIKLGFSFKINFVGVDIFDEKERGLNGFGSSSNNK